MSGLILTEAKSGMLALHHCMRTENKTTDQIIIYYESTVDSTVYEIISTYQ